MTRGNPNWFATTQDHRKPQTFQTAWQQALQANERWIPLDTFPTAPAEPSRQALADSKAVDRLRRDGIRSRKSLKSGA